MRQFESLDARTHFNAGDLDTHFGDYGLTQLTVPYSVPSKEPSLLPLGMATDANGRTIVAAFSNTRVTLRRLDAFGAVDASFSASALGQTFNYADSPSRANRFDFAVDATNRIDVLNDKVVTRYTSSGKIDRTFGRNGRASVAALDQVADLDVGADGRIWVGGTKNAGASLGNRMAVLRLSADGAIDTAFASKGLYVTAAPAVDRQSHDGLARGEAIRANADGSAVLAGTGSYYERDRVSDSSYAIRYSVAQSIKLTPQGRLDTAYGIRGLAVRSDLTDDVQSTYPAILGIRGSGAVVVGVSYSTDSPTPPYGGTYRSGITPSGDVDSHTYQTLATTTPGTFLPTGDGSDYFVSSEGILKLGANSKVDTTFNGGRFLTIGTAASIANNGELTFAGTGSRQADGRFGVGRYFTSEGPSATYIQAAQTKPAAALTFTVWYDDDDGVDYQSLNNRDLIVTGESYGAVAALMSTRIDPDTARVIARYELPTYGGRGSMQIKNGLYAVNLTGARLGMHDLTGNRPTPRQIGTIVIANT